MLGLSGFGVFLAYVLTIAAAVLCVVYGIMNWNKPSMEEEKKEIAEEQAWEKNDPDLGGKK